MPGDSRSDEEAIAVWDANHAPPAMAFFVCATRERGGIPDDHQG
ncbi:uridylate kinase [Streptomyces viridosporus ATCC 14672]|uniref:Uridylate kinase n=1 Tax=Streptomyces viridosporus (strain ATCC 14672 / DSM 40746 / JCM 4963 / KCTC 9882 / NRRL B-12104 / FH 1290) TaxID=566461 RepID=D5ZUI0_STRV1|nr:uridylate kinase [Streptomyces viridosporus ATCC 14672]